MSCIDPRLLSKSNGDRTMPTSATAAPAQPSQRAQRRRRTKSIVVRGPIVLRPIEPRPQRGPHSNNTSGAAGLQDSLPMIPMIKPRKPRAKSIKITRKSGERKAKDTPHETESDEDSGSVVASDHGIRWKDGLMQWWDNEDRRWSMMPHYVVTLGRKY